MTPREQDVLRLDVPVHHPHAVGRRQGVHNVSQEAGRLRHRKLPLPGQPVP
jgi:hypothetical protein